jgi:hypothetical protein
MQTKMRDMQALMDRIHSTTGPKERRKLMQEHMRAMQDGMATMRSMSRPMTTHGGQGGGMAMGDGKAAPGGKGMMDGDVMHHHQMMEERLGMMEMMMEQMLQHQQMSESVPAR